MVHQATWKVRGKHVNRNERFQILNLTKISLRNDIRLLLMENVDIFIDYNTYLAELTLILTFQSLTRFLLVHLLQL